MGSNLFQIVIAGSGLTGMLAAAMLSHRLGNQLQLTLIDCPVDCDEYTQVQATLPAIDGFLTQMGIDKQVLLSENIATPLLATRYSANQVDFFVPFEAPGFSIKGQPFYQYANADQLIGNSAPYDSYSLASQAAKIGTYYPQSNNPNSLLATLSQGLQIHTARFTNYLTTIVKDRGVNIVSCDRFNAEQSDGLIDFIRLDDGKCITADHYIDASGADAQLANLVDDSWQPFGKDFQKVSRVVETKADNASCLYAAVELFDGGFKHSLNAPDIHEQVVSYFGDHSVASINMVQGHRNLQWCGNVLALGAASANLETFVAGPMHWVLTALIRYLDCFASNNQQYSRDEFNRLSAHEWQYRTLFFDLHRYLATGDELANQSLMHEILLFKRAGIVALTDSDALPKCLTTSLLLGFGHWPDRVDQQVLANGDQFISEQLAKMKAMIETAAKKMPPYKPA